MPLRIVALALVLAGVLLAQPKRVLYLTHSAGFRHDSIPESAQVLQQLARASGRVDIVWSEDAASISSSNLAGFDGVLFFTSGELPLNDAQRRALLDFVEQGGGFAGVHSATDTLYSWPEYGNLIGGYFNGHPWVNEVRIDVEDPEHPTTRHLAPGFRIVDEIYQFRGLSREHVRVLMTLDTSSVDLAAPGVQAGTNDFPLAWTRMHGDGRVFYTALGHFEGTWRDPRFQEMMLNALLWITREVEGEGAARPPNAPTILGLGNAATLDPPGTVSPGSFVSIFGQNLTPGSSGAADGPEYALKLAGASVAVNGSPASLLYASPSQLNIRVPADMTGDEASITVWSASRSVSSLAATDTAAPGIFAVTFDRGVLVVWATGLGAVREDLRTAAETHVRVGGRDAAVLYSGMSPEWPGLYQVNIQIPAGLTGSAVVELRMAGSDLTTTREVQLP